MSEAKICREDVQMLLPKSAEMATDGKGARDAGPAGDVLCSEWEVEMNSRKDGYQK